MIKSYIKNSSFWKKVSHSNLYQMFRFPEKYKEQQEEPNFYKNFLKYHPSNQSLIFDIGANKGYKSVIFSKLVKKVVAFEPSEKLYHYLQKRFVNSNVIIYNLALGSSVCESDFYLVENNEAYNSLNKKHIESITASRGIATIENVMHKKVKVEVVEKFIEKYGVPKYIKIDVEGFEYEVIKGMKTPVPLISFEANLPEFYDESIQSIEYLDLISFNNYRFNFATANFFYLKIS
jgi:FkbM family methyltransferase